MIWKPHTDSPKKLKPILIAKKDICGDGYYLERGQFVINEEGKLMDYFTLVAKPYFRNYFWVYENDVLEGLLN